mgnify:CR=1 FL=1
MGTYLRLGEYKINPIKIFRKYAVKKKMGKYNIWHYYIFSMNDGAEETMIGITIEEKKTKILVGFIV